MYQLNIIIENLEIIKKKINKMWSIKNPKNRQVAKTLEVGPLLLPSFRERERRGGRGREQNIFQCRH
jgi:hypothetical protein